MKSVNVRELKNNPSRALREARQQPIVVVSRNQPEALIVHLGDESLLAESGVRLALATSLYREESLSLGQAARFAGTPIADFMQHVSRLRIPVVRGTSVSVREDANAIEESQRGPSRRTRAG